MTGLIQTSSEEAGRDRPLWLLVGAPLVLGPEFASRRAEHGLLWRMSLFIEQMQKMHKYEKRPLLICKLIINFNILWLICVGGAKLIVHGLCMLFIFTGLI